MRIERHIFGSTDGYQTLASSPGLSSEECKALQGFAFGTIYDPKVRESFRKMPGYWSRPVGRRRRAITRILLGDPDDAGRPTLLFISAVVSADDWDRVLQGDARPLLQCGALWKWDRSQELAALDGSGLRPSPWRISGEALQRVLGLLSLLEQSWSFRKPVVVREQSYTFDEILSVERILPPVIRCGYSAVYRGLDGQMPVSLNALTQSVHATGANPFRQLSGATSPYARRLLSEGISDGHIPLAVIHGYRHFAKPVVETTGFESEIDMMSSSSTQPRASPSTASKTRGRLVLAASIALSLIVGGALGWLAHRPPPNPWPAIVAQAVAIPLRPNDERPHALNELSEKIDSIRTDEPNGASGLNESIKSLIGDVKAEYNAETLIARVQPNDTRASSEATGAIDRLRNESNDRLVTWLEDRLNARRQPRQDTLKHAMEELCRDVESANSDAVASPNTNAATSRALKLLDHVQRWTIQVPPVNQGMVYDTVRFLETLVNEKAARLVSDRESRPAASPEQQATIVKAKDTDNDRLPDNLYTALEKILDLFDHQLAVEVFDGQQRDLLVPLLRECAAACDTVNDLGNLKKVFDGVRGKLQGIKFTPPPAQDSLIEVQDPDLRQALKDCIVAADELRQQQEMFKKGQRVGSTQKEPGEIKKARKYFIQSKNKVKKALEEHAKPGK